MKQILKIWVMVVALVMGGALPPQLTGDNEVTTQWCAQAKSKKKSKKNKKKNKKKSVKSVKSVNVLTKKHLRFYAKQNLLIAKWYQPKFGKG